MIVSNNNNSQPNFGMKIKLKHVKEIPELVNYKSNFIPTATYKGIKRFPEAKRPTIIQNLNKKLDKAGVFDNLPKFKLFKNMTEEARVETAILGKNRGDNNSPMFRLFSNH